MPDCLINVALVEDRLETREALEYLLNTSPGLRCVGAFGSAEEAVRGLPAARPHVALVDIGLPGQSGIESIRELKRVCPSLKVVMLTVFDDHDYSQPLPGNPGEHSRKYSAAILSRSGYCKLTRRGD